MTPEEAALVGVTGHSIGSDLAIGRQFVSEVTPFAAKKYPNETGAIVIWQPGDMTCGEITQHVNALRTYQKTLNTSYMFSGVLGSGLMLLIVFAVFVFSYKLWSPWYDGLCDWSHRMADRWWAK